MANKYLDKDGLSHLIEKINAKLLGKQPNLVSGTNIKTINNTSILGSGNIDVSNANTVDGFHVVKLTQAQYNALATKDTNTIYMIVG